MLLQLALTPLWPAYGEALSRGDVAWVRRTWMRSLLATLAAGLLLIIGGPLLVSPLLGVWMGPAYPTDAGLILACAASVAAMSLAHAASMLANGAGRLAFQAWCGVALLLATLLVKPILGLWLGPAGLPWATAVCAAAWCR